MGALIAIHGGGDASPIFGMGASAWWLGESLPAWKLAGAALVLGGLAINLTWPRLHARWLGELAPRIRSG